MPICPARPLLRPRSPAHEAFQLLSLVGVVSRAHRAAAQGGLGYDYIPVHLVRGEHHDPAYTGRVGDALVPTLLTDDGVALSQSMAIIEYLDETHPSPPLLPAEPLARAHVRALAQMVACEMHPPNNLRVLNYLVQTLKVDEAGEERLVQPLGPQRAGGLRAPVGAAGAAARSAGPGTVRVLLGRCPYAGRLLPGAACVQLPAFQRPFTRPAADHGRLCCLHGAARIPAGAALGLP